MIGFRYDKNIKYKIHRIYRLASKVNLYLNLSVKPDDKRIKAGLNEIKTVIEKILSES